MLELRYYGDEILHTPTDGVSKYPHEQDLLAMWNTMYYHKGIGLAAPQVGLNERYFVYDIDDGNGPQIIYDPEIVHTDGEWELFTEGCLSVPGFHKNLARPKRCVLQGKDSRLRDITIEADGLLARMFLHEVDHLDGIVFIDKLNREDRRKALRTMKKHL